MGMRAMIDLALDQSENSVSVSSVCTHPGAMPLQRMPLPDHSLLSARITPPTPDLAAA